VAYLEKSLAYNLRLVAKRAMPITRGKTLCIIC